MKVNVRKIGHVDIVVAGRRIARGVVVDEDEPRGVEPDRVAEELSDPHQRGRDVAAVDRGHGPHAVAGVEQYHPQLLARQMTQVRQQARSEIPRTPDGPTSRGPVAQRTAPQLEGKHGMGGLVVIGALTLYLDFINLFLLLLRASNRR